MGVIRTEQDEMYTCPRCGKEGIISYRRWTVAHMPTRCVECEGLVGISPRRAPSWTGWTVLTSLAAAASAVLGIWIQHNVDEGAFWDLKISPYWLLLLLIVPLVISVYRSRRHPLVPVDDVHTG